jgi:hypothetical protein
MDETGINLLKYLRSKTQVDLDTFDITGMMGDYPEPSK